MDFKWESPIWSVFFFFFVEFSFDDFLVDGTSLTLRVWITLLSVLLWLPFFLLCSEAAADLFEPATPPFEKISVFFFFRSSDFILECLAILLFLALGCFSKFLVSTSAILRWALWPEKRGKKCIIIFFYSFELLLVQKIILFFFAIKKSTKNRNFVIVFKIAKNVFEDPLKMEKKKLKLTLLGFSGRTRWKCWQIIPCWNISNILGTIRTWSCFSSSFFLLMKILKFSKFFWEIFFQPLFWHLFSFNGIQFMAFIFHEMSFKHRFSFKIFAKSLVKTKLRINSFFCFFVPMWRFENTSDGFVKMPKTETILVLNIIWRMGVVAIFVFQFP